MSRPTKTITELLTGAKQALDAQPRQSATDRLAATLDALLELTDLQRQRSYPIAGEPGRLTDITALFQALQEQVDALDTQSTEGASLKDALLQEITADQVIATHYLTRLQMEYNRQQLLSRSDGSEQTITDRFSPYMALPTGEASLVSEPATMVQSIVFTPSDQNAQDVNTYIGQRYKVWGTTTPDYLDPEQHAQYTVQLFTATGIEVEGVVRSDHPVWNGTQLTRSTPQAQAFCDNLDTTLPMTTNLGAGNPVSAGVAHATDIVWADTSVGDIVNFAFDGSLDVTFTKPFFLSSLSVTVTPASALQGMIVVRTDGTQIILKEDPQQPGTYLFDGAWATGFRLLLNSADAIPTPVEYDMYLGAVQVQDADGTEYEYVLVDRPAAHGVSV